MSIKKYKVYWSIWYFGEGTQKPIASMQGWVKMFTAAIGGTAYFTNNEIAAAVIMGTGFVIDAILSCVILEEKV